MEVKIGVLNVPREVILDTNAAADEVERELGRALEESGVMALEDTRGRRVLIPAANIAYVELGSPTSGTVGFR